MNWLKRSLRQWLMPELDTVTGLMDEILWAKDELKLVDKNITFEEPVVFLGSMADCKVEVKPNITAEITLAKVDIPAGLSVSGNNGIITNSMFSNQPTAIKKDL